MPSAIRVPFANPAAVDPTFRIDIRDPTTGAVGLNVGQFVNVAAFRGAYWTRPGQSDYEVLHKTQLWSLFVYAQLGELPVSRRIEGLDADRYDLTPPRGAFPRALHAFIPAGPSYPELQGSVTAQTTYKDLRSVLADVIACQAVWYLRTLHGRPEEFEMRSTRPGIDGQIWQLWKMARPNANRLYAMYIVSIRRAQLGSTWVYFPEVEIRA